MKRHDALRPLSHDHHHALVAARRARAAEAAEPAERRLAARGFLAFFAGDGVRHFREEEELVFPLLVDAVGDAPPLLVRALTDHARLHAVALRLGEELASSAISGETLAKAAALLEAHVRLEERELFPLIEQTVPHERLAALAERLDGTAAATPEEVVDVSIDARPGTGPVWGIATEELNATVLAWPAGRGVAEHVNRERDVLLVPLAGSGTVEIDGRPHPVEPGVVVVLRRGAARSISAGPDGLRYLSAHRRRAGLMPS